MGTTQSLPQVPGALATGPKSNWPPSKAHAVAACVFVALAHLFFVASFERWIPWYQIAFLQTFGFMYFPFLMWLVVPGIFSFREIKAEQFTWKNWEKRDWIALSIIALGFVCALPLVRWLPELSSAYGSRAALSTPAKFTFLAQRTLWLISWLPAWEFLHRFFLLRALQSLFPRRGWLGVAVFEGAFHAVKPWPECLGMIALSLFLTHRVKQNGNLLFPILIHLSIELCLIFFLVFV